MGLTMLLNATRYDAVMLRSICLLCQFPSAPAPQTISDRSCPNGTASSVHVGGATLNFDLRMCVCVCECVTLSLSARVSLSFFHAFFLSLSLSLSVFLYLSVSIKQIYKYKQRAATSTADAVLHD